MTDDELMHAAELAEMLLKAERMGLVRRNADEENALLLKACLMLGTEINFEYDRIRSNRGSRSRTVSTGGMGK